MYLYKAQTMHAGTHINFDSNYFYTNCGIMSLYLPEFAQQFKNIFSNNY